MNLAPIAILLGQGVKGLFKLGRNISERLTTPRPSKKEIEKSLLDLEMKRTEAIRADIIGHRRQGTISRFETEETLRNIK
jgi:hypothetical protein